MAWKVSVEMGKVNSRGIHEERLDAGFLLLTFCRRDFDGYRGQ